MSKREFKLAPNVLDFLNECSKEVGKAEADYFNYDTFDRVTSDTDNSPIEHLFYIAIRTIIKLNGFNMSGPNCILADFSSKKKWVDYMPDGIDISPQYKIGEYRADFKITYFNKGFVLNKENIENNDGKKVLVECDSQQFHERTEAERRYEKKRDRFFQKKGYDVLHYTGKEIKDDPMAIALDVISYITGEDKENLSVDSNIKEE